MISVLDLYSNSKLIKSTSKFAKKKDVTLAEIRDIFEHSNIPDSENPFKVTYMCEEDYDELYELQLALKDFGFTLMQKEININKTEKVFSIVWNTLFIMCVLATLVLGILKLSSVLMISWFIVFIPMISMVATTALVAIIAIILALLFLKEEDEVSESDKME